VPKRSALRPAVFLDRDGTIAEAAHSIWRRLK
jgi:histidinol phosphatase-like enzyme